jgi:hypothetical protein
MKLPKLKLLVESLNDQNRLVGALKKNDIEGAKKALTTMMQGKRKEFSAADEVGLENSQFTTLTKALQDGDIEKAKEAAGIGSMKLRGPFASFMEPSEEIEDPKVKPDVLDDAVNGMWDYFQLDEEGNEAKALAFFDKMVQQHKDLDVALLKKQNPREYKALDYMIQQTFDNKKIPEKNRKAIQIIAKKVWKLEDVTDPQDLAVLDLLQGKK